MNLLKKIKIKNPLCTFFLKKFKRKSLPALPLALAVRGNDVCCEYMVNSSASTLQNAKALRLRKRGGISRCHKSNGQVINFLKRLVPFATLASVFSACNYSGSTDPIPPLNITAIKAPLYGALSFVDRNNDGSFSTGEEKAITRSDGTATINLSSAVSDSVKVVISSIKVGDIIDGITYVKGTIDTGTGDTIEDLTLKAPATYAVVTPVTTIVAETGLSEDKVKKALDLPVNLNLRNFNPFKENRTAEEDSIALATEKVALKIHATISTIQGSAIGTGLNVNESFSAAIEGLAEVVKYQVDSGQKANLADTSIIDKVITATSAKITGKLVAKGLDAITAEESTKIFNTILEEAKKQIKTINDSTDDIKTFDKNELGSIAKLIQKSKKEATEAVVAEKISPGSGRGKFTMTTNNETNTETSANETHTEGIASAEGGKDDPSTPSSSTSSTSKILVLHGGGETSTSFMGQDGLVSLMSNLSEYEFVFAEAPSNNLWMQDPPGGKSKPSTDSNWAQDSITYLDNLVSQHGPFFGILGYSQGAAFIPVYLADTLNTFNIALMYNGYLPTTHHGLIAKINLAAPFHIPSVVFSGEYDYYFRDLAQGLADKFYNSLYIRSSVAAHHLPFENDPAFDEILNFITINESSSISTNSGSLSLPVENIKDTSDSGFGTEFKTLLHKSTNSSGELTFFWEENNSFNMENFNYLMSDTKSVETIVNPEHNYLL